MEQLIYRSPLGERTGKNRKFADWLKELGNHSGAYVIRRTLNNKILYVGESHTGRLQTTIKRHFWKWSEDETHFHFTCDPADVEIAVRITPQKAAKGAQDNLIRRLKPKHNTIGMPEEEDAF